jgi:hypothetical protein
MMKLLLAVFAFMNCVLLIRDAHSRQPDWLLVAKSQLIVVGKLSSRKGVDPIEPATNRTYQTAEVFDVSTIKGSVLGKTMTVLLRSDAAVDWQKRAIFYLTSSRDAPTPGFYLAADPSVAIQDYSTELAERVRSIHEENLAFKKNGEAFRPSVSDAFALFIKGHIDALASVDMRRRAVRNLEDWGIRAVPYLIYYLDDWREFGGGFLSLRNRGPGHFEAIRHYGPEVMADAIAAILNQITGMSFGFIYNGASTERRKLAIDGWRCYLGRILSNNTLLKPQLLSDPSAE